MRPIQIVAVGLLALAPLVPPVRAGAEGPSSRPSMPATAPLLPTSRPAANQDAEKLAAFIQAIRRAEDPREALSAYAKGCAISRLNAELHTAHIRRMLQFGRPETAYYPALAAVRIEPENGMAWGVLGYVHGKRNRLDEALAAAVRAAKYAPDDASILHNAGQLVAWYDGQRPPPKLADPVQRLVEEVRRDLGKRKAFAEAHDKVQAVFAKRDQEAEKVEAKIAVVKSDGLAVQQQAEALDRQLRALNDQIRTRKETIRDLRGEVHRLEEEESNVLRRSARRQGLNNRIQEERRALGQAETDAARALTEGRAAIAKMNRKAGELRQLDRQLQGILARARPDFRWDPPGVDGVVTPEAARVAQRPTTTTAPADAETKAQKRLAVARLYLDHSMEEKAHAILREIVDQYGSTQAGAEARALLLKLSARSGAPRQP